MSSRPAFAALLVAAWPTMAGAELPAPDGGDREYATIDHAFPERPREATLEALDELVRRFPQSPAAPRALLWHAQLELAGRHDFSAALRFRAIMQRYPASPQRPFAQRGLGDLALRAGRLDEAEREYAAAGEGATPALSADLASKKVAVAVARARRRIGLGALALYLAACGALAALAARGRGPLRMPLESIYAAPLLTALAASAWLADRRVVPALAMCAAGSLALITLSGLASERSGRGARVVFAQVVALLIGLGALCYFAAWQGDLIDLLHDTILPAID